MPQVEETVLDAAYDAMEVLVRETNRHTSPFQIGVMAQAQWTCQGDPMKQAPVTRGLGVERIKLVCCSTEMARAVFQRVLEIAGTPIFADRCRNPSDQTVEIDPSAPQSVIYLTRYTEIATDVGPEDPTMPGVPRAISGTRPKARSAKSA
jgi:hypothetical protein